MHIKSAIMDLFSKCDHIRNFLRICSHLLKKIPLKKVKVKVKDTRTKSATLLLALKKFHTFF